MDMNVAGVDVSKVSIVSMRRQDEGWGLLLRDDIQILIETVRQQILLEQSERDDDYQYEEPEYSEPDYEEIEELPAPNDE